MYRYYNLTVLDQFMQNFMILKTNPGHNYVKYICIGIDVVMKHIINRTTFKYKTNFI